MIETGGLYLMFFGKKYRKLEQVIFRTGSAMARTYKVYHYDFTTGLMETYQERYPDVIEDRKSTILIERINLSYQKAFGAAGILDWENSYVNRMIKDGHQWNLKMIFKNGKEKEIFGSNAYPEDWNTLMLIVRQTDRTLK